MVSWHFTAPLPPVDATYLSQLTYISDKAHAKMAYICLNEEKCVLGKSCLSYPYLF